MRLTELAVSGGGCGCKIGPAHLSDLLRSFRSDYQNPNWLLVGNEGNEDSAAFRTPEGQITLATLDFSPPVVDEAEVWGKIAACNAFSDIFAMGGRPLIAVAILGFPVDKLDDDTIRSTLEGARQVCTQAKALMVGGHSINVSEPIFGLSVVGTVEEKRVVRNNAASRGDKIFLTKPIGTGVCFSAIRDRDPAINADTNFYLQVVSNACKLNDFGRTISDIQGITSMTDVTGFGLVGHLHEMMLGCNLTARLNISAVPFLDAAVHLSQLGKQTSGTSRNLDYYSKDVRFSSESDDWRKRLLFDPQTNGGLLFTAKADAVNDVHRIADSQQQRVYDIGEVVEREQSPLVVFDAR